MHVTNVTITQKTECTSYQCYNHRKQSVLVTRVIITQKTECASYQRNNYTENRLRYLQRKGNDQRNDRTEKRFCELPT